MNTGSAILEKRTGTILGKSVVNVLDHYIVLLDNPLPESLAVSIPEFCLERISNECQT